MPKPARRGVSRVEREWTDLLFQPLDDVFRLAGTAGMNDAQHLAQGMAYAWITWYMALSKPVRRRNLKVLLDQLDVHGPNRVELLRVLADEGIAFQFLTQLMVVLVEAAWRTGDRDDSGADTVPPTIDWDLWLGPGSHEEP